MRSSNVRRNYRRGKQSEIMFEAQLAFCGRRASRTGVGHDYISAPMFGSGPTHYHEIKSGEHSRLSQKQRQAQRELRNRYYVHRIEPDFGIERASKRARKLLR